MKYRGWLDYCRGREAGLDYCGSREARPDYCRGGEARPDYCSGRLFFLKISHLIKVLVVKRYLSGS